MIGHILATRPAHDPFESIGFCGCGSGASDVIEPAAEHGLRVAGVYGSNEGQLLAFARERMARYRVPARMIHLDASPTVQSANAIEVQKARLREIARELRSARARS